MMGTRLAPKPCETAAPVAHSIVTPVRPRGMAAPRRATWRRMRRRSAIRRPTQCKSQLSAECGVWTLQTRDPKPLCYFRLSSPGTRRVCDPSRSMASIFAITPRKSSMVVCSNSQALAIVGLAAFGATYLWRTHSGENPSALPSTGSSSKAGDCGGLGSTQHQIWLRS